MIITQKSRKKLLLSKHYYYYYYYYFQFSHYNSKGNSFYLTISQLLQEEKFRYKTEKHKKPRNKIYVSPPFPLFSHHSNRNWTPTKYKFNKNKLKKTENSERVLNKRRERTLRIRMDHVVKVDEMKRETDKQTVGWSGKQRIEEKLWRV